MKSTIGLVGMVLGIVLLPLGTVYASKIEPAVKADTKDAFNAVAAQVRKEMVPGGRYEFIQPAERNTVDTGLTDMQALFDKYGTVAGMDKDAKFKLYLDQENVNAILTRRDDRRIICKSERPMGSLLPKSTCRTYGEIERGRQYSQQFMGEQAIPGFMSGGANPSAKAGQPIIH